MKEIYFIYLMKKKEKRKCINAKTWGLVDF